VVAIKPFVQSPPNYFYHLSKDHAVFRGTEVELSNRESITYIGETTSDSQPKYVIHDPLGDNYE
jgi:hypothetical protein